MYEPRRTQKVTAQFDGSVSLDITDTDVHESDDIVVGSSKFMSAVIELSKNDAADGTISIELWVCIEARNGEHWGEFLDEPWGVLTISTTEFDSNQYKQYVTTALPIAGDKLKFRVTRSSSTGRITIDAITLILH